MSHCPACRPSSDSPSAWCSECGAHRSNELAGHLAGFGRRAAAAAVDAGAFVLWLVAFKVVDGMGQSDFLDPPFSAEEHALILGTLTYVAVGLWLWLTGRSIGKATLGLRVVDRQGQTAGVARVLLRETLGKLCSSIPLCAGYLVALGDSAGQTWHDKIAGTYVVRQDAELRRRLRRRQSPAAKRRRRAVTA